MRIKQTIPTYIVGQQVTILDNLSLRERTTSRDAGLGNWNGRDMLRYQGTVVTISRVNDIFYSIENDGGEFSWTPNMFKESYDFEATLLTPPPEYHGGQIVTIHNNLGLGRDFHGVTINDSMLRKVGHSARIIRHIGGSLRAYKIQFLDETLESPWNWTVSCFSQSYTEQNIVAEIDNELSKPKVKKEDFTIDDVKVGMYIFHDSYNSGNSRHILAIVTNVTEENISLKYVHKTDLNDYQLHNDIVTMDEEHTIRAITIRGNDLNNMPIKIKYARGKQYIVEAMYIPDERDLKSIFGLSNEKFFEDPLKEGMTPIPDLFKDSKFKLKKVDLQVNKKRYKDIYAFYIKDTLFIGVLGLNSYKSLNADMVLKNHGIGHKDYKDVLVNTCAVKVKSFEDSATIFGHKTRKEAMFNSVKKEDGKTKTIFKIHNVIFNYEKEGKYYHVLEVNDGTLNLKFLLSDLELMLPNVNNYVFPKERTIKTQTICKVTRDKLLPVSKGSKVTVVKMFNRHVPIKGTYDKNTVCVVVDSNNKQFECKVHQLKRV